MKYEESKEILGKIQKADKILVNCHRNPDPDSVGSALALYLALTKMGKKVKVVSPDKVLGYLDFLPNMETVETIDYSDFDFSGYDLFIALDSSSWFMVSGNKDISPPDIPIIKIDHHKTGDKFGLINLVDDSMSSAAELLYWVLKDIEVKIDKDLAECLLTGILGDTGNFSFPTVNAQTLKVGSELMRIGADKSMIVLHIFRSQDFNLLKFWGEVLSSLEFDRKYRFVWSAISYRTYKKMESPEIGRETAAAMFMQIVEGTDMGVIMVEQEEGVLSISFRSRSGFDTTQVASLLGGGGHVYASGARISGLPFEKAVDLVLKSIREVKSEKNI